MTIPHDSSLDAHVKSYTGYVYIITLQALLLNLSICRLSRKEFVFDNPAIN